jgi:hypothetical protein
MITVNDYLRESHNIFNYCVSDRPGSVVQESLSGAFLRFAKACLLRDRKPEHARMAIFVWAINYSSVEGGYVSGPQQLVGDKVYEEKPKVKYTLPEYIALLDQMTDVVADADRAGVPEQYPGSIREVVWYYDTQVSNEKPIFPIPLLNETQPWHEYVEACAFVYETITEKYQDIVLDKGYMFESINNFAVMAWVANVPLEVCKYFVETVARDYNFMKEGTLLGKWNTRGHVSDHVDLGEYRAVFDWAAIHLRRSAFPFSDEMFDFIDWDSEKGYEIIRIYLSSYYTPDRPYIPMEGDGAFENLEPRVLSEE